MEVILVLISHFKISIFWSKLQNPHYLGPEVDDVDEEGDHHCSDHRSKICHSWINLADDNTEKRLVITLAICSKCSKIYLIPFAELSILDVVFALRIPCSCVLWEKGFGKHNRSVSFGNIIFVTGCLDSDHLALRILYRARAERKGTMEVTAVQTNQGLL